MRVAKILIDEDAGGRSCIEVLPKMCNDPSVGTRAEVVQCTGLMNCQGCAMIRVTDPNGILDNFCKSTKNGSCDFGVYSLSRVSGNQFVAIVKNYSCEVVKMVIDAGCFITSAVRVEEKGKPRICWTVMGPDEKTIRGLVKTFREADIGVEEMTNYSPESAYALTAKQEQSVKLALENGYYDVPKRVDVRELCGMAGVSRSTYDVSLRTAEKKIISKYFDTNEDKE